MNNIILIWLPPATLVFLYLLRVMEMATRRQIVAGAIRENMTLRLFISIGTVMLAGSLTEYFYFHKTLSWPFYGAALAVGLFSFYVRRQAIAALGRFWSLHVEIRDTHELVREGPFRWVRHPAYTSMILEILAMALVVMSWRTAIVVYAAFLPTLMARIRIEEKALIEKFGEAYIEFKRTTPALFPKIGAPVMTKHLDFPQPRRSVVTGMGVMTPSGLDLGTFWHNISHGISAAAPIMRFDASKLPVRIAAEVKGFNLQNYLPEVREKRLDRSVQYAVAAAASALKDSGVDLTNMDPDRAGVVEGTTMSGAGSILKSHTSFLADKSYRSMHPYNLIASYCGEGSSSISIYLGIQGPVMTYCTGCAAGNDAIGYAAKMVQQDELDVVVAGGSDEIPEIFHIGFCKLRTMSEYNDDPQRAMRPFDRKRDGFVLGEGAAFVVIEELSHAVARGATIYAEIMGHGRTAEAHHPTDPHPDGIGYKAALRRAFRNSRMHPEEIDYINAHGSATPKNDPIETGAIKEVFGSHARRLAVSGTKAITGHLMGASGAVESVVAMMAIKKQLIPPTINLTDPDEGCDLDYVTEPRPYPVRAAVNLNAGFGGRYSCLIFRQFNGT